MKLIERIRGPGRRHAALVDGAVLWLAEWAAPDEGRGIAYDRIELETVEGGEPEGARRQPIKHCRLLVPGSEAFSYIVDLPTTDPAEMASMARFEVRKLIPLDPEHLLFGVQVLHQDESQSRVLLVAVPEDVVEGHLSLLEARGIGVDSVQVSFLQLYRYYASRCVESEPCAAVLDLNESFLDLIVVQDGELVLQRSVPLTSRDAPVDQEAIQAELARSYRFIETRGLALPGVVHTNIHNGTLAPNAGLGEGVEVRRLPPFEPRTVPASLAGALEPDAAPSLGVDLLPARIRRRRETVERVRLYALAAVGAIAFVALLLALNAVFYAKEERYLEYLLERKAALGVEAEELSRMMDQIERSRQEILAQYRLMGIINSVTSRAPVDVGIDHLRVDGERTVQVGGQADSRQALLAFMGELERSGVFSEVKALSMPLRSMSDRQVVDYQLELTLAAEDARS